MLIILLPARVSRAVNLFRSAPIQLQFTDTDIALSSHVW